VELEGDEKRGEGGGGNQEGRDKIEEASRKEENTEARTKKKMGQDVKRNTGDKPHSKKENYATKITSHKEAGRERCRCERKRRLKKRKKKKRGATRKKKDSHKR